VIASNYGRPRHPAWYHNLRAHPRAPVTVDRRTYDVDAPELTGAERARCFDEVAKIHPGFDVYRRRASDRRIPVMRLDRRRRPESTVPLGGTGSSRQSQ
jgi:deazaflavin-dependent oxidoreductase (nitroreductase family)